MLESIIRFDTWLFLQLNAGAANSVCDWLMPWVTELRNWFPLIILGLAAVAVFGKGRGRTIVLTAIVLFALTDQVSSHLIKPLVARPRPCHTVEGVRLLYSCGATYAFPSSHAVTTMAAAFFFGLLYRRILWPLFFLSVIVSYSRIYLGIHYPLDTLGGWMIGAAMSLGGVWTYRHHIQPFANRFRWFRDDSTANSSHAANAE
jgi:undecaprenyl-diphosphatase